MSTVHLTLEEKRELKQAEMRQRQLRATKQYIATQRRRQKVQKAKRAKIAAAHAAELVADPPTPETVEMFGPAQTALSPLVRPAEVPVQASIPENIALDRFIEDIAAQPDFVATMGENIEDARIARFLALLADPANHSMTWCARSCGLTNADMANIWRKSKLTRAFFRIVNRMEAVANKVVDDALGSKRVCPRCDGMRRIEVPENMREFFNGDTTAVCPQCDGAGFIINVGSAPHTQLIWERIGWSKKAGGVSVNVNMADHSIDATSIELEGIENEVVLEHQA